MEESEPILLTTEELVATRSEIGAQALADIDYHRDTPRGRLFKKLLVAAASGIPGIGAFVAAGMEYKFDESNEELAEVQRLWSNALEEEIKELKRALAFLTKRLEELGAEAMRRAESEGYLRMVRKTFQGWDRADSDAKRHYFANLLANAAGTAYAPDDMVRLFIEWIDRFNDSHFRIIRHVYDYQPCTRYEIAEAFFGGSENIPREDAAEADLFSELFRELNMGGLVRQRRDTDPDGRFYRRRPATRARRGQASPLLASRFDDEKPQVLSELGRKFVRYVFEDVGVRIGEQTAERSAPS